MPGAKPQVNAQGNRQCVPMKDTPFVDITAYSATDPNLNPNLPNPNLAFTYFLNIDDDTPYTNASGVVVGDSYYNLSRLVPGKQNSPNDYYGSSNRYRNVTFFLGRWRAARIYFSLLHNPT